MKSYKEKYLEWLNNPIFDEDTHKELESIKDKEEEIEERFYKDLEFGTSGLRGVMAAGTNMINIYTIGKAAQGLANYIIKKGGQEKGVVIAYDSRNMSKEFSKRAALCLVANGIKVYLFEDVRPTPELSFAIRNLKTIAGIVVTASHNPKEYNGFKVYGDDGAQVVPPVDKEIINEVNSIEDFNEIKIISEEDAIKTKLYTIIGKDLDDLYINEIKKQIINPNLIKEKQSNLKIVYSPLHGTGGMLVKRVLKEIGYDNLYIVQEQEKPNGEFPTVSYPNPEDENAFKLAINLAKEVDADIVLANDPDADRMGMYVKHNNEYIKFTGNMTGNLLAEFILSNLKESKNIPNDGAIISTIVSSNLTKEICKFYGVNYFETLTGYKNIAKIIRDFEEKKNYNCLFSYEESYGCIIGTHSRDKDGIIAVMMLCEAALYYLDKGLTLWDQMLNIYKKYGYFLEDVYSITLNGVLGAEKIKNIMEDIRNKKLHKIGKYDVICIKDYKNLTSTNIQNNIKKNLDSDKSNVLYYELENNAWCCLRPSGTEPKIKLYYGVCSKDLETSKSELNELKSSLLNIIL